jgi:asparaginyl-tRNA synthetase
LLCTSKKANRVITLSTVQLLNSSFKKALASSAFAGALFKQLNNRLEQIVICRLVNEHISQLLFRAENSNTSRHLAEFWMIEPEIAFADLSDNAALAEALLKYTFAALLNERQEDLAFFDQRIEKGLLAKLEGIVGSEFVHMDYGEAIQVLERANEKFEFPVKWGIDLQSEHKPVIVMNYPKAIKAFYMRVNDDGRTVAAMDALASGIGEIIGGGQREERLEGLDRSMAERGIDREHYAWYREPRSRCSAQRLCTLDSRTLPGTVHRLPQIAAPLHVQPEIGAVAEYAR